MTGLAGAAPIFLLGFMGSGKSTVGVALAARLSRPFIDLDQRIEAVAERTIADIIEREGEEGFRRLESETLLQVAEAPAAIVALGGGAFARAENRELIRRVGVSVWLDAPFELCWRRILEHDIARPLAPDEASARARYEARLPLYGQSDVRIEVSAAMSAEEIVELIIERLAGSRSQAEERA